MNATKTRSCLVKLAGVCAAVLVLSISATAHAILLGAYTFDGTPDSTMPDPIPELNGNTALDLNLMGFAHYTADTPFSYAGNTSLDVTTGVNDGARNDATTVYDFVNNAAWSIHAWIKTSASGATQTIVAHRQASTGNGYTMALTSSGLPFILVQGQSSPDGRYAQGNVAINDGGWHQVVVVNDPDVDADGALLIYVDGSLAGSDVKVQPNAIDYGNSKFSIGVQRDLNTGNVNPFNGLIDEVALFSHALTIPEITALYNSSLVPEPASIGLVLLGAAAILRRRR